MQNMKGACRCGHHKAIPFLIVVLGVTFMMGFSGMMSWLAVNTVWPMVIIAIGIAKLIERMEMCKCCEGGVCNGC